MPTIPKGDHVQIHVTAAIRDFTVLDVIPREKGPLNDDTFFSQLHANAHNHKLPEDGDGWIIIDTEEIGFIAKNIFAAIYK